MASQRVRRFHRSDRLIHFANAFCWLLLGVSGVLLGAAARSETRAAREVLATHFVAGLLLTIAVLLYALFAHGRLRRLLFEIFRTDRPFAAWFRTLGGYPARAVNALFGRSVFNPDVPEQGRFNAGQKVAYAGLLLSNAALLLSGFALFGLHAPAQTQSAAYEAALLVHSLSFAAATLLLAAHIPMGLVSKASRRAILPWSCGTLPLSDAAAHAPLWVRDDLMPESASKGGASGVLCERPL